MTAVLLVIIAVIAYTMGSISTPNVTSHLIFHENIQKYSRDNVGITRFMMRHGRGGLVKLILAELIKTAIPVLIGGLLMLIVGHAQIGYAFALFCVVLGTNFPIMYDFRGEHSLLALMMGIFFVSSEVAIAGIFVFVVMYFVSRYISASAMLASLLMFVVAVMSIDDSLVVYIFGFTNLLVIVEYRKSIIRLIKHKEPKFRYKQDVSFMFDDDFGSGDEIKK